MVSRLGPFLTLLIFKGVRGLVLTTRNIGTRMGPVVLTVLDLVTIIY